MSEEATPSAIILGYDYYDNTSTEWNGAFRGEMAHRMSKLTIAPHFVTETQDIRERHCALTKCICVFPNGTELPRDHNYGHRPDSEGVVEKEAREHSAEEHSGNRHEDRRQEHTLEDVEIETSHNDTGNREIHCIEK
eukprot:gene336-biopygen140